MTLHRKQIYELIALHLEESGLSPRIDGDSLHIGVADLVFRLRLDRPKRGAVTSPAMFVWLDVLGFERRQMSFDLSGWGMSPVDQAMDLAHGIIESIVPPLRWLTGDPTMTGALMMEWAPDWEIYAGLPWVIAASSEGDVDGVAEEIRRSIRAAPREMVLRLQDVLLPETQQAVPHWIKVYIAKLPNGPEGRIDVDNAKSWPGVALASGFPWASPTAIQLVRQLLVMRPRGFVMSGAGAASATLGGRVRGLFRRG